MYCAHQAKIAKYCAGPAEDACVFVCGVPALYAALCGPRDQKGVAAGTVLQRLGYLDHMVFKF